MQMNVTFTSLTSVIMYNTMILILRELRVYHQVEYRDVLCI